MRRVAYTAILCLLAGWTLADMVGLRAGEIQAQRTTTGGKTALLMTPMAKSWGFIRYNTATGQAFQGVGDELQAYTEPAPIPPGEYEIQSVPSGEGRAVVRIDRVSGRVWTTREGAWFEMKEAPKK